MVDVRKIRLIMELRESGITDSKVLSVIEKIPRMNFIPETFKHQAYENIALPIGNDQTISQPLIVALMTQNLELIKTHKVLELGTGSGYQTAILSKLCRRVYTIERIKELSIKAENTLKDLKITNVVTKVGDGNKGWFEQRPFDRIIITAATKELSKNIISQIKDEGIIIAPMIGEDGKQILKKFIRKDKKIISQNITEVIFVPNLPGSVN
ncbi:MAG: Protein-L-isoaspartate O-methyltransferase [Alphaproteobacteria bacterium MarineAlpha5_Bin11]|nr:protein-L-isoaspartate O-methyltransferase [Pelagibacteraceae bacterium]PPR42582.1 MAG: Protein-L-isoaspartate O-methyltransferase [Alphaproteobacteria bacterium MarineAlpha5_Bin11]